MLSVAKEYSSFSNYAFLLEESIAVAKLMLKPEGSKEITHFIVEENILGRRSKASRQTLARVLLQRLEPISQELLSFLVSGSQALRRYTNLYLILLQHRLLREFLAELVYDHWRKLVTVITETELKAFFETKQLEPQLANWSVQTYKKSQTNILRICQEAELLVKLQDGYEIRAGWVPNDLKSYLMRMGQEQYLTLMLDGDA